MDLLLLLLLSLALSAVAVAHHEHLLPRPLILDPLPETLLSDRFDDDPFLVCNAWRFAGEANNLSPWKTIPPECAAFVADYATGRAYAVDLEMVAREAGAYARDVGLGGDGMDAWVFDVDETLISNLPYYAEHGFGLEVFNVHEFDKWVDEASAPAIPSSLKLYKEILDLGIKIVLLTGRSEGQRHVTIYNLNNAGYENWEKLILRGEHDHGKTATTYKSEKRSELEIEGYRILGNSGDQWSDLQGFPTASRSFKLPNPMYYIP
ncbi:Acid phosphatase 1 [Acorus gramineus]|uniref:Acid phosphatase 1 n=1 Tax=Acorus gramineus TaxID=55184 RepID=A0AAV9AFD0_ACOGR|nr:Acid phosphatase 1 [Acorus gramineus]